MTIILTGATGGLGQCIVRKIHESGYDKIHDRLVCCYRNEDKFKKLFANIETDLLKYKTHENEDFKALIEMDEVAGSDFIILILNAFSIAPIKPVGEFSQDEIDSMLTGNIKNNVSLVNRIIRLSKEKRIKLRIINLDSGAANFPLKGWGNYCASKAYIDAFLGVAALENPYIETVSFDPGVMDTDMQRQIRECSGAVFDKVDEFRAYKEQGRLRRPEDVAAQIAERYIYSWTAKGLREKID
jgi:benzil reductase ((S)-benzoin forming)